MSARPQPELMIRRAGLEDAPVCGRICYDAFNTLNARHGFPCDFPGPDATTGVLSMMFSHPGFYCLVAEIGGRIVGSNCLDERSMIAGVGPITVDPESQNSGAGRKLMLAVMGRARERGSAGVHGTGGKGNGCRGLQRCFREGSRFRPRRGTDGCDQPGLGPGGGTRRPDYRVCVVARFLRPRYRGNEPGFTGAHRIGRVVRRVGNPGAVAEQRAFSVVPGERVACSAGSHADERRAL